MIAEKPGKQEDTDTETDIASSVGFVTSESVGRCRRAGKRPSKAPPKVAEKEVCPDPSRRRSKRISKPALKNSEQINLDQDEPVKLLSPSESSMAQSSSETKSPIIKAASSPKEPIDLSPRNDLPRTMLVRSSQENDEAEPEIPNHQFLKSIKNSVTQYKRQDKRK